MTNADAKIFIFNKPDHGNIQRQLNQSMRHGHVRQEVHSSARRQALPVNQEILCVNNKVQVYLAFLQCSWLIDWQILTLPSKSYPLEK